MISLSAFGYWYVGSNSRFDLKYANSLDIFSPNKLNITKIEYKKLQKDEAEIFRLILKYSSTLSMLEAYNLAKLIKDECEYRDMDPSVILGVIMVESSFLPDALSNKGAVGLMQLMPSTGRYMAKKEGMNLKSKQELYDPQVNVKLGIAYLSMLETQFNNIERALGAYNYGPRKFESYVGKNDSSKLLPQYVYKVLKYKNTFEDELKNI